MAERPILMSGPMVCAIIEGRKSQTRRMVKPQPAKGYEIKWSEHNPGWWVLHHDQANTWSPIRCRHGRRGDRLWVRENGWERPERSARDMREGADTWAPYYYDADGETGEDLKTWGFKRRPSIHMPRWACRLVLELTAVRVERLQEISGYDAEREGCKRAVQFDPNGRTAVERYRLLWDSLNAKRAPWASNPWVWVLEFKIANP